MVNCPKCDATIEVDEDELDANDVVECEECGAALRVLSTDPLELKSDKEDDEEEEDKDEDEDEEEDEDDELDDEDDLEDDDDEDEDEKDW